MTTKLARRIQSLAAVEISLVLVAAIVAGALLAFGFYVRTLSNELSGTMAQLEASLTRTSPADARSGGAFAGSLLLGTGSEIVFLDAGTRVTVYRIHRADARPTVSVRRRGDLSGDPRVSGPVANVILGLATAFGLQPLYAHVGNLYIIVRSNSVTLVSTVRTFLIPLLIALLIAIACGILIARVLTRQALRPLDDVTAALQRFASGDLTPQLIAADARHELGSLAVAYNGAIEQMERAFTARDRANASMRLFIADAGHQLRTPLTVVQGFIAILRRGGFESPSDRDRILDTMNDQGRIMGSLIDKLILLERWESPEAIPSSTPIDIGTLVADLVGPIADAHPDRRFDLSTPPGILASIDPTELGYVVTNLADNAVKYGEGEIAVRVRSQDSSAVIEVADEGPGIPSTDATRVFDRFYRGAQRDVPGSGLGLAIVKRAVERAHGAISLDTSPRGSRFIVQFPLAS
ncbi:MAG TPA: HAMP domain-containing sensor histidine kinase [Candidatus Cybelea sp.]|jgi:two-component system OmpR family sensor kinase|nr:HAMP domain-containing sensor histidine kinase [Candidatus Cybelea sp.]